MKNLKKIFPIFIIIILSYFAIKPFFINGFFPIHDDAQVQRVFEMHKALNDGMFPVRWVSDLGYNYGYPIFNFYAPLAYYIGAFFMLIGFDALISTKIMMVLGIILAGIFMYLLAKEFWGIWGGLISALLYIYAPFHALDIYVRGDVAEYYAYAFIPLIFLGLYKIKNSTKLWIIPAGIGYAGVILSHNLTAMMITPFIFIFAIILFFNSKSSKRYLLFLSLFLGILLSAFYWLPVFSEMKYTNVLSQVGGGADYKDHFVCLPQLWNSPWGFGGSAPGCTDGLSFKIGKLHILLFLVSVVSSFFILKKDKLKFWIGIFSIISVLFAVFLTLNYSQFIWATIPQMAFLQYPWRFLLVIAFFVSFMGGAVILLLSRLLHNSFAKAVIIAIALLIVFLNTEIFMPQTIIGKTASDYINDFNLRWTTSKISDEYMPKSFYKPKNPNEVPENRLTNTNKNVSISSYKEKTQMIHAQVMATENEEILVNLAYFPAWNVFVDSKPVLFSSSDKGLLVTIPSGTHNLDIKFAQTPIERSANYLSLAGVLMVFLAIIYEWKGNRSEQKST